MPDNPHHPHVNLEALSKRADALLADLAELVDQLNAIRKAKSPDQINAQLKAVGDSIRKLESQGIPIPDDLRKLKITLASDLCQVEEVERIRAKVSEQSAQALARLGTAHYLSPQPSAAPVTHRRKQKAQDANILDLFNWKKSANGTST